MSHMAFYNIVSDNEISFSSDDYDMDDHSNWCVAKVWKSPVSDRWGIMVDAYFAPDPDGKHPYLVIEPSPVNERGYTKDRALIEAVATLMGIIDGLQSDLVQMENKITKGVDQTDDIPLLLRRLADRIERRGK
jgi:hypothetical protein